MRSLLPFALFVAGLGMLVPVLFPAVGKQQLEEVCDNAVDDDEDSLIDLNDPDCDCPVIEPVSLIPNPSFEENTCCPMDISQLNCAVTWIQASEPTTDYIHTCGFMGWDAFPVPQPIPDGQGAVGFRDGRVSMEDSDPTWKEYAGACLLAPLRTGTTYRFQFWVGFAKPINSPPISIHFFGSTDCENLPFGIGDTEFGCPTNGPGWMLLGTSPVAGNNNWVQTFIDVTPTQNIHAIAIGPGCVDRTTGHNLYYFFDNLVLDEQTTFEFVIKDNGANPCSDAFTLQVPHYDSLHYQWYLDGVALIGETAATLQPNQVEGQYQVRVTNSAECKTTTIYPYIKPKSETAMDVVICEGESFPFGNRMLDTAGDYVRTAKSVHQCDSIISLNLQLAAANEIDSVQARIFPTESYQVGPYSYTTEGNHLSLLSSIYGCDSLVFLELTHYKVFAPNVFSPNDDGINDRFTIMGGEDLLSISSLQVYDRWGNLVYQGNELQPGDYLAGWNGRQNGNEQGEGVYVYTAILLLEDGKERRLSGSVMLMR